MTVDAALAYRRFFITSKMIPTPEFLKQSRCMAAGVAVILTFAITNGGLCQQDTRNKIRNEIRLLSPGDTNYINKLYKYGETFELENNDSAFSWYERANALSLRHNFINGQLRYYDYTSVLLVYLGRYDEAIPLIEKALQLSAKHNRRRFQAIELNQYGTIWQYKFEMHRAAELYMQSYKTAELINDRELMNVVAGNLSGVFLEIGQFDKAREFSQINIDLAKDTRDTLALGYGLINMAACDVEEKRYRSARTQSRQAIAIAHRYSDEALELFAMNNLGRIMKASGQVDSAIFFFGKSMALAEKQEIDYHLMLATQGLGDCFSTRRDFRLSLTYYLEAMRWAKKSHNLRKTAELHRALSETYENTGDLKNAIASRKLYDQCRDSIQEAEQDRTILELEARYQSEKRQRQLTEKNLEVEQEKNTANIRLFWMAGLTILLLTAITVIIQRVKISRAREQNFRKELEFNVLKAGENERTRIAKDLHDDVGSTLSSIHVYSKAAQMHWEKKPEEVPVLIQRISVNSENMMDRMSDIIWSMNINKDSGEKVAMRVKTFAQEVLGSKDIETFFDLEALEAIDLTLESRKNFLLIFKEAINNIAKYSDAQNVWLKSTTEKAVLAISIKDDGKGFTINGRMWGNGLGNMKHRAGLMGGEMTIRTASGEGTEITFTVPVAKISDVNYSAF